MSNTKFSVLALFIFIITTAYPAFSQDISEKPRIAVKKLIVSDPDNIQLQVISDRVTKNTELVLKFMNNYELASIDFSKNAEPEELLLEYCNKNNIDNIVYGKTYAGSGNSFVIEMSVYSREKEQTAFTQRGTAETALDIFDASDKLTASIIEEFSGVHIAFGKIHITNTGVTGSYQPFVDGEPFSRDAASIENLLIGRRTVEIKQYRMLGETVIHTQDIIVKENSITELSFEIPHLLPAESEVIADQDKIIEKNRDKRKKKEKVIRAFNEIDTILTDTPWNITLSDLREEYRNKREEYEADYAELMKKGTREFIVGASMGVTVGMINIRDDGDGNKDSPYNPIIQDDWNDDKKPAPSFGVNVQYQLLGSLYLQTELNYKDVQFYETGGVDNYIKYFEIPLLLKLVKQLGNHRIGMYIGPSYYEYEEAGGGFDYDVEPGIFTNLENNEDGIAVLMGLEYGYKKGRHLLTAGLRYSMLNAGNYSFFDPDNNETYDHDLQVRIPEIILGYGYNLGGSGRITEEKDRNKWLFPAETGLMFMLGDNEDNTDFFAGGGFLRKITSSIYGGIKGFGFSEGGFPMLSVAYTKDPDKIIHNYSAVVLPFMDMVIGAFQYNIGISKFSLGAFLGGPLDEGLENMAIGIGAGYYF